MAVFGVLALCQVPAVAVWTTEAECRSAWNESDASDDCAGNSGGYGAPEIVGGNHCVVRAYCLDSSGAEPEYEYTSYSSGTTDPYGDLRALKNCDGTLKRSSC